MPKTKRLQPYAILIAEILIFYTGFGWLFGVWEQPNYPNESNLYLNVFFSYALGVLTFVFFVALLPPSLVETSFSQVTITFIVLALPCIFSSQLLIDALQLDRLDGNYFKALAEEWDTEVGSSVAGTTFHAVGFMAALGVRKKLYSAHLKNQS